MAGSALLQGRLPFFLLPFLAAYADTDISGMCGRDDAGRTTHGLSSVAATGLSIPKRTTACFGSTVGVRRRMKHSIGDN